MSLEQSSVVDDDHYDLAKDTASLVEPSGTEEHGRLVENLQLIQPHFRDESACCARSTFVFLFLVSCMAGLGGVLFGYDIGIVSGAILQLRTEYGLDCLQQEMVVSSMLMGAVLASLTGGFIVDHVGRRMAIIVNSVIFFVGAMILAFSPSFAVVVVGRIVVGFGVSLSAIAECIYISEIAPPKKRGLLVSINEVGICVGLLFAYFINVLFIDSDDGWRYMFGISAVPAVIQGVGMFFLPKSPRWLIVKGKDQQACATINQLRWLGDPHDEVMRIKSGLRVEYKYKFSDLVSNVDNMRSRMVIGCGIVFFQQFTGQPTVVYYASTIFQALGFQNGSDATLASLGIGLAKLGATLISLSTVDKGGRRRFLLIGASVMSLSIFVLGVISHLKPVSLGSSTRLCHFNTSTMATTNTPSSQQPTARTPSVSNWSSTAVSPTAVPPEAAELSPAVRYGSLAAVVLFVGAFSFGFGPVSWLLLSEIYPAGIKGRAFSIATSLNWGSNLVVSLTFLDMLSTFGTAWTFIAYALIGIVAVLFIYRIVPETKNKTLEQISAELSSRKPLTCPTKLPCCKKARPARRLVRRFSQGGSASDMLLSVACSETQA